MSLSLADSVEIMLKSLSRLIFFTFICAEVHVLVSVCITQEVFVCVRVCVCVCACVHACVCVIISLYGWGLFMFTLIRYLGFMVFFVTA